MSQFFESICVKDGIAKNLAAHQARVNKTLEAFNASNNGIELTSIVHQLTIPEAGLFKLRISYDLNGNYQTALNPYQYKLIQNFALVDIKGHRYDYKYENRDWINDALSQSGTDEIMMHDDGCIKDCSYTNIVFYDGSHWYTPESPLLEGTQRANLIQVGVIIPKALHINDLPNFKKFKCINAMIHWEDAVEYKIDLIRKYFP
jgi:4-amino-4-deoxychorismate lyase